MERRTIRAIAEKLLERFGEPIGQDVSQRSERSHRRKRSLDEDITPGEVNEPTCNQCGAMMPLESDSCNQCGSMAEHMDESEEGGRHPGHASSCTCPDCSRSAQKQVTSDIDEEAPPYGGREQVSPSELMTTWEDLIISSRQNNRPGDIKGITPDAVSFDELTSWLGASPDAVQQAMRKTGLVTDRDGNVVERGHSTPKPMRAFGR